MPLTIGPINAASPTPLLPDGELDLASVPRLVQRWLDIRLDGAMVLGTMGEGRFLSDAARNAMVERSVEEAAGRLTVFATVADVSRPRMIERALRYARMGAPCIVLCLPQGQPAGRAIEDVIATAEACPVPCAYYDIPENTGIPLVLEQVLRILEHPNIVALKDSSGNALLAQALSSPQHRPAHLKLLHGNEYTCVQTALLGYDGYLHGGGVLTGRHTRQIWDAVHAGRLEEAMQMDRDNSLGLASIYNRFSQPLQNIAGQKHVLKLLGVFEHDAVVVEQKLDDAARARIAKALEQYGSWLRSPSAAPAAV